MYVIVESFLYSDYPTPEREEDKKMYRNDVFERIAYIMKNTDKENNQVQLRQDGEADDNVHVLNLIFNTNTHSY